MEKIKAYGALLLGLISAFNLGVYAVLTKNHIKEIQIHHWFLTIAFGAYFISVFISKIKNLEK